MKTISVKYPHPQSVRLNNAHAHQQSARVTKVLIFMLASAVGLSILINIQQPLTNFVRANFSNYNFNNTNNSTNNNSNHTNNTPARESRLIAVAPVMPDSAAKAEKNYNDIKLIKSSIEALAAISENEKAELVKAEAARAATVKMNRTFLKENDSKNADVMSELSQVTELHEYHFKKSYSQIETKGMQQLDSTLQKYIAAPESYSKIIILGFTDNRGTKLKNVKLGLKRAESLKAMLVKKGIPAEKITVASFGSELPIASNNNEDGRYRNRRVELNVLGAAAATATATGN